MVAVKVVFGVACLIALMSCSCYGYAVEADSAEVEYQQNYQQEDDPEYQQDILEDQQDNAEYQQKRYDPIADQAQDDATQDDNAKIQHASRCCNGPAPKPVFKVKEVTLTLRHGQSDYAACAGTYKKLSVGLVRGKPVYHKSAGHARIIFSDGGRWVITAAHYIFVILNGATGGFYGSQHSTALEPCDAPVWEARYSVKCT